MSKYFSEPKSSEGKMKVELDLSNYATKVNLKAETQVLIYRTSLKRLIRKLKI